MNTLPKAEIDQLLREGEDKLSLLQEHGAYPFSAPSITPAPEFDESDATTPPPIDDDDTSQTITDEQFDFLLSTADAINALREQQDPIVTIREMWVEDEPTAIVFASCAHLGSRYTFHKGFRDVMHQLLEIPNLRWASLGDDIDGFIPTFRDREAIMDQALSVPIQRLMLEGMLNRIGDRLLFGTTSQHGDQWERRNSGDNPIKRAYRKHGVPYFDGLGYIKLHVGEQTYFLAVAHEFRGHSQYHPFQGPLRALYWQFPNADALIQGDKHQCAFSEMPVYGWEYEIGNRQSPIVHLVMAGTAKTGPDKYSIQWWGRGHFAWPVLVFDNKKHNIMVTRETRLIKRALEEGWE